MAAKTEKELSEAQRAHWLKAVAAIELRNFGYAISLLQGILKQEPEFLTGRQLLRRAEVTKYNAVKKSFFNMSTSQIAVMKAQRELMHVLEHHEGETPHGIHRDLGEDTVAHLRFPISTAVALRDMLDKIILAATPTPGGSN